MKKWLFSGLCAVMVFTSMNLRGQSPCASLTVIPSQLPMIPCDTTVSLTIGFNATINLNFPVNATDTYAVNQIPYNPLPWVGTNSVLNNIDDQWSQVVQLPFPFCFFGNTYTSYVIGSNGRISFDTTLAGTFDAWATQGPPVITAPNATQNTMNNTIMAPYHDTDPSVGTSTQITWDTFGVAPCRTMVINWTSLPMFSCNTLIDSQQIVLYELSNVIDINIGNKPVCATWNGGLALEGIQNSTGTTAFTVPGRNNTVWTANDDSWRFEPAGTPYPFTTRYTWRDGTTNAVLGMGSNINISTPFPSSIICEAAIFGGCTNDTTYARDTTFFLPGKLDANFDTDIRLGCDEDTVFFTNNTNPMTSTTFFWSFGDGNFSTDVDPMHIYGVQGNFPVQLVATHPVCIGDTANVFVNVNHPITAGFDTAPDSVCLGESILISNASQATAPVPAPNLFVNTWDMGDGNVFVNNSAQFPYTYTQPGTYTIKLVITDTLGCQDSTTNIVFIEDSSFVSLVASPTEICLGDPVIFKDSSAPHTISTTYDFGDGTILSNIHNPKHTYQTTGTYNVTYSGFYLICPDQIATASIQVDDYPLLNLGEDRDLCPGLDTAAILSNIENPSQVLTWSTGKQAPSLTVKLSETGRYWASAANNGCVATDSIWVKRDCYLNIPNSFSPNNDGLNDYFIPRQLLAAGLKEFSMKIMNRWGEVIFQTDNLNGRGWDGKYGGKDQPLGVYVYLIEAQWKNNYRNSFRGNVTLMR